MDNKQQPENKHQADLNEQIENPIPDIDLGEHPTVIWEEGQDEEPETDKKDTKSDIIFSIIWDTLPVIIGALGSFFMFDLAPWTLLWGYALGSCVVGYRFLRNHVFLDEAFATDLICIIGSALLSICGVIVYPIKLTMNIIRLVNLKNK